MANYPKGNLPYHVEYTKAGITSVNWKFDSEHFLKRDAQKRVDELEIDGWRVRIIEKRY